MHAKFYTLKDFDFNCKRVLVRADFNVPLDKRGRILNDRRIRASLPTIKYLLKKNAKIILMSHLGRPDGKAVKRLRMNAVAKRLSKLLGKKVVKLDDCIGEKVKFRIDRMANKDIILLENLRFYKGEEKNNKKFSKSLAELGDIYVNDAFGSSHREHSSIVGVAKLLPSCAGALMQKEIEMLSFRNYKRPFIAIIGGVKVGDKIKVIDNLLKKADKLLLGGAMVFTFYRALGLETGKCIVEKEGIAKILIKKYRDKLFLPSDIVAVKKIKPMAKYKNIAAYRLSTDDVGVDIGRETVKTYKSILKSARTVFWNGPLGICEAGFAKGTKEIARLLVKSRAKVIVGGGDTVAVIEKLKLDKRFAHVSTGGGASLEFIEKSTLPGINALMEK